MTDLERCKLITGMINARLDRFEYKLDRVLKFYWLVTGAASGISAFVGSQIYKIFF